MDAILNMTVGQLLHKATHHIAYVLVFLSVLLNFEAVVRQVAVNRGYKNVVSFCDRIASIITFILEVGEGITKKNVTKAVPVILLCVSIALFSGCAPLDMYKAGCGNLASTKNTVPYTFGTLDASGNGCYLIHYGKTTPDFEPIKTMMTTYMNTSKPNTLVTSDGSTVMVIPPAVKK